MKYLITVAATAATFGALTLGGCNRNEEANNAAARSADVASTTKPAQSPQAAAAGPTAQHAADWMSGAATSQPTDLALVPDAKAIRSFLADVADDAFGKGAFTDLAGRFAQADKDRIKQFKDADVTQLDGIIDTLQRQWNSRYGHDFAVKDADTIYHEEFARIWEGEETGKYGEAITAGSTATTQPSVMTNVDKPGSVAAEENRNDKGRNVAKITIAAENGLPELTVPLIHQFPASWKIDVPDTLDGPHFLQNLERELTAVKNSSAQWPADENQAYRMVTHHVLMAVMDSKPAAQ